MSGQPGPRPDGTAGSTDAPGGASSATPGGPVRRPIHYPQARMPETKQSFRLSALVSVALHALLLLLIIGSQTHAFGLFGTGGGVGPAGGGGGGGGERVTYVELPSFVPTRAERAAEPPKPEPVKLELAAPQLEPVERVPPQQLISRLLDSEIPAVRLGSGNGVGGDVGADHGDGGGKGGGSGTGIGSDRGPGTGGDQTIVLAPEPRSVIYPLDDPPASVRGVELSIRFWVDRRGRVTRVEILTPIADDQYEKKLVEAMSQWIFYPARTAAGLAAAGQLVITHRP